LAAKYVLSVMAMIFMMLSAARIVRDGGRIAPASRTWLTIGIIFALVGGYLWMNG